MRRAILPLVATILGSSLSLAYAVGKKEDQFANIQTVDGMATGAFGSVRSTPAVIPTQDGTAEMSCQVISYQDGNDVTCTIVDQTGTLMTCISGDDWVVNAVGFMTGDSMVSMKVFLTGVHAGGCERITVKNSSTYRAKSML